MDKSKHVFTQEESQEMYTMLYTLVYALKDIQKNGLNVNSISQIGDNLAYLFRSLERVVTQASKLLAKIDDPEPPFVQETIDRLLKNDNPPDEGKPEEK